MRNHKANLIAVMLLAASVAQGSEFRSIRPIAAPARQHNSVSVRGIQRIKNLQTTKSKVSRLAIEKVRKALPALANAWNGAGLDSWLSDKFYDKSRFLDSLHLTSHTDAKLRIMAVDSVRLLGTNIKRSNRGLLFETRVAANVQTQVEYNDPSSGFQRRDGRSEFVFVVAQSVPFVNGAAK